MSHEASLEISRDVCQEISEVISCQGLSHEVHQGISQELMQGGGAQEVIT